MLLYLLNYINNTREAMQILYNFTVILCCVIPCIAVNADYGCGRTVFPAKHNRFIDKIVGGTVAEKGSWPWQIHLARTVSFLGLFNTTTFGCGGTIIDQQWIITAAHCVDPKTASLHFIRVGQHDSSIQEPHARNYGVDRVIVHENYVSYVYKNDIALLHLTTPIEYSDYVQPACLADEGHDPLPGTECAATGWGHTDPKPPPIFGKEAYYAEHSTKAALGSSLLRQVFVNVVDRSICNGTDYYKGKITDAMLCAGSPGKDACQGDSGGPFVCTSTGNGKSAQTYTLVGVTSWGHGCAAERRPGVYTRIGKFKAWIEGKIATAAFVCHFELSRATMVSIGGLIELVFLAAVFVPTGRANQCGIPSIRPNTKINKIVGGQDVIKGSWPWQVRIGYRRATWFGTSIDLICGGSLISPRYIVTAAHCVDHDQTPSKYQVTAGDFDRTVIEDSEENYEVKRIIMYPQYRPDTTDNDLALLELEENVQFGREVWPICLPEKGFDPSTGTRCFATGWGDTEATEWARSIQSRALTRAQSVILQQVAVYTMSREMCRQRYYPGLISDQMICAGYDEGGKDPCKADSGGPLACLNRYGGFDLVGVISWGHGCAWSKQPGVYTRVGSFVDWIADNAF
ncbi:transmembrane protease serine 9-like [Paramacrobiotus metropolitanus]|uniref:transmembrane protease serine 9-like n=1 Tax=Paramacrobiotus metropolitanus TaxID=2943436 RepID=UPI002445B204|nr:transmembrane protease serine 9-like [Paramacrobiotus metropolitanus]